MNFGIVGLGNIATRFIQDSRHVESAVISAGASHTAEKRRKFKDLYDLPVVYDRYEALFQDADVDCVYIAVPHSLHKELTMRALAHHKHVLVEKPAALSVQDWDQMCEEARRQNCFLMEALKTPFYPTSQLIRQAIQAGEIGEVQQVDVNYCYDLKDQNKPGWYIYQPDQGGALRDIGSYLYYFVLDLFPGPYTLRQTQAQLRGSIDLRFQCKLETDAGISIYTEGAINAERPREAIITGSRGHIRVPYYYRAEEFTIETDQKQSTIKPEICYPDLAGEIQECIRCVENGWLESPLYPQVQTRAVLELMENIRSSFDDQLINTF